MKLERDFYMCDGLTLAKKLLGKILVRNGPEGEAAGRIVETEAYMGKTDPAAHSYRSGRDGRTAIQYGCGGFAYIYLIYGMYSCINVVANLPEYPEVVLLRALEPVRGIELMKKRRGTDKLKNLCSGPGKLCRALDIDRSLYGADLTGGSLFIEDDGAAEPEIAASARINIDYAGEAKDWPWRFCVKDSGYLTRA